MAGLTTTPVRVAFVVHVMQVAGAEVLVSETITRLGPRIDPAIYCLDQVGPIGERLRAQGVPVQSFDRRPGFDFSVSRRMARAIDAQHVDVLHAHQYTPFFYGGLAARLSRSRPRVIFTEHGRHYPDVVSAKRRWANKTIFSRLADRVNAVCEFSARQLRANDGFDRMPIAVIENGIDPERYGRAADRVAALLGLGLDPARRYIATVARFHPVKDHRTLLQAFAKIAASHTDTDLLLVGDGPLRGDLEALANELGLARRIRFLGVRHDVPAILGAVDIFALTSLSEAASITLLEAMASALPVVVTDVGGNPEIVRRGIDGVLAPRGDSAAIAEAFTTLLDDHVRARQMGDAGAARVHEHYRLNRTIARYGELYETLRAQA